MPAQIAILQQGYGYFENFMSYAFVLFNPNAELMLRDANYQIVVYDASGVVLNTESGVIGAVGPGQQTAIAETVQFALGAQIARLEVSVRGGVFVQAPQLPQLPVDKIALVSAEVPRITGIVSNPFNTDIENLPVVAIAYDDVGAIIGGGTDSVPFLAAQGQAAVEIRVAITGTAARLELYPQLNDNLQP